jgi:hypothetical protein
MAASDDTGIRAERARDVRTLLIRCMEVGRPAMIWGAPGVGKSDLIASIGKEMNRPVIDMRLLLLEPTDIKGIPYFDPDTKTMKWAQPSDLPTETFLSNAILFLDEINAAPPSVQAAAYQLILNRRVGEYHLPKNVSMLCAGNRDSDKGVTYRMPSPLANRLVHIEMRADFEDWQQWAIMSKVHPDVVGFLSHHKQHLFNFNPKSPDKAFATPRSWAFVSQLISDNLPESMNTTLVSGTVGSGLATEFTAHRKVSAKMPKAEDVLLGKEKSLNVKELSAMYSLTISLCYTLQEWYHRAADVQETEFSIADWHKCVDNFFTFMMDNFQTEMTVLGAKVALRDYKLKINHRDLKTFKTFHDKFGSYILED